MKFTLITCALGAAGLSPALQGALGGDPAAPLAPTSAQTQPALPFAADPAAPAAPTFPQLGSVTPAPVVAGVPIGPGAPIAAGAPLVHGQRIVAGVPTPASEPFPVKLRVAGLRTQRDDLARDADRLREEIERLRVELETVRRRLKSEEGGERRLRIGRRIEARDAREAREAVEGRIRRFLDVTEERESEKNDRLRERAMEQRERAMELRERVEERRAEAQERARNIREEARERVEEIRIEAMERAAEAQERAEEAAERIRADSVEYLLRHVEGHESEVHDAHGHGGEDHKFPEYGRLVFKSDDGESFTFEVDGDQETVEERVMLRGKSKGDKESNIFVFKKGSSGDPVVEFQGSAENFFDTKGSGKGRLRAKSGGTSWSSGGKIDAGGPNTFNIHVEDGDVHIHAHGNSSFTTGKTSKSSDRVGSAKGLFGQANPEQETQSIGLFARIKAEDGEEPVFDLKINGEDVEIDDLGEMLSSVGGLGIKMSIAEALGDLEGLAGLKGLEGLDGLAKIKVMGLEDLEGLEGLLDGMDIDFDFDVEINEECEEIEEEEIEIEESKGSTRERFVGTLRNGGQKNVWAPASYHWSENQLGEWIQPADGQAQRQNQWPSPSAATRSQSAWPSASQQGAQPGARPGAQFPGVARAAQHDERLLDLARQIRQDVAEMRAELKELRAEVLAAEPRGRRRR